MKYLASVVTIVFLLLMSILAFSAGSNNKRIIFAKKVPVTRSNCYPTINKILKRCLERGDSDSFCRNQYQNNRKICKEMQAKHSHGTSSGIARYTACIEKAQCVYKTTKTERKSCYSDCRQKTSHT